MTCRLPDWCTGPSQTTQSAASNRCAILFEYLTEMRRAGLFFALEHDFEIVRGMAMKGAQGHRSAVRIDYNAGLVFGRATGVDASIPYSWSKRAGGPFGGVDWSAIVVRVDDQGSLGLRNFPLAINDRRRIGHPGRCEQPRVEIQAWCIRLVMASALRRIPSLDHSRYWGSSTARRTDPGSACWCAVVNARMSDSGVAAKLLAASRR